MTATPSAPQVFRPWSVEQRGFREWDYSRPFPSHNRCLPHHAVFAGLQCWLWLSDTGYPPINSQILRSIALVLSSISEILLLQICRNRCFFLVTFFSSDKKAAVRVSSLVKFSNKIRFERKQLNGEEDN